MAPSAAIGAPFSVATCELSLLRNLVQNKANLWLREERKNIKSLCFSSITFSAFVARLVFFHFVVVGSGSFFAIFVLFVFKKSLV